MAYIPTKEDDLPPTRAQVIEYDEFIKAGRETDTSPEEPTEQEAIVEKSEADRVIEETVITQICMIGYERTIAAALDAGIESDHFSDKRLGEIFRRMAKQHESREPIDCLSALLGAMDDGLITAAEVGTLSDVCHREANPLTIKSNLIELKRRHGKRKAAGLMRKAELYLRDGNRAKAVELLELAEIAEATSGNARTRYPFEDYSEYWQGHIETALPEVGHFTTEKALFYRGAVNSIYGAPGKGKSWIALCVAKEQIELGNDVIFIDPESSAKRIICRLKMLKTNHELAGKHFHYSNETDTKRIQELQRWAANRENVFVIYDGLANPIAASGKDENSNAALSILQDQVKPFADTGSSVLVVDHTGKDEGKGARGHSSKPGFYKGAIYAVKVGKPFSTASDGHLLLRMDKDNESGTGLTVGQIAAELVVIVANGASKFELCEPTHVDEAKAGAQAKMTDDEILKSLPVGEDRAMNFQSISPVLNAKTFAARCKEIDGVHVELRKGPSGQLQNYFWRNGSGKGGEGED